jgi:hypothetical protein
MTLREQIIADVSTVFLNTDEFAETCRRLVDGEESLSRPIVGIPSNDQFAAEDLRGRGYTHMRFFTIAEDTVLNEKDAIRIGSLRYEVESIADPVSGMKTARLIRYQQEVKSGRLFRTGES